MEIFPKPNRGTQEYRNNISSWDVVVLSFKLFFEQLHYWIGTNILAILLSLPVITAPAANAALNKTVAAGLRDPVRSRTNIFQEMKTSFLSNFGRALVLALLNWLVLAVILISLWFWITRDTWLLRSFSIVSLYGLIMWWLANGYLYPILVEHPELNVIQVIKAAARLAFQKPFESLLFATVSTILLVFGVILLGPVLLVIPALRSIIHLHGYWYLTNTEIPGFIDPVEFAEKYYPLRRRP